MKLKETYVPIILGGAGFPLMLKRILPRDFLKPTFYLSSELGEEIFPYVSKLVGDDERFFFPKDVGKSKNYNYNQNTVLIKAIGKGYRGAYWDILRKVQV